MEIIFIGLMSVIVSHILKIVGAKVYLIIRLCSLALIIQSGFCVANGRTMP
jgi:hypothetical protein